MAEISPIASVYDGDENGDQNRLNEWLRFDMWSRDDAALIFADINPESVKHDFKYATTFRGAPILDRDNQGNLICLWVEEDGTNVYGGTDELERLYKCCSDLQRTLVTKDHASPKEWIDSAISKKFDIPWLEWAKNRGLVGNTATAGVPVPGKEPHTAIGKLAIKAAWQIECGTGMAATPRQVIEMLQAWKKNNPTITGIIPNGVTWETRGKTKNYDIGACEKTLERWRKVDAE